MRPYAIPTGIIFATFWAAPAWALDMEFHTYGGFNAVANAFRQVALILSDSGFTGLFYVVAVLGVLFGGIAFFMRMVGGLHLDPISWTWPIMLGMAVYMAAVVPKGSLTIYDPVLNRFETISDLPDGVILIAGTLNKVERGLVEIIDTAAPPTAKYAQGAGGIGFTALKHIMDADIKNAHIKQSLGRYMEDCVLFEMSRPGTTLTLNNLVNGNTDYLPELAKAVNPAVYTVYFNTAAPNGTAMTCTDAWTSLNLYLSNTANFTGAINAAAGRTLFDPANAAETTQFKTLVTDTLQQTTGLATTPEMVARQGLVSRVLFQVLQEGDPSLAMTVQANRQATQSGIGMLVAANEWLPIIKAVLTTVAIGLIPILLLFIPTPLIGKTLGIIVGFFLFLASWGVTDAIVHSAAMNAAAQAFEEIRQSGLALDACLMFPEVSTKTLAMFGTIRSGGILLASMLTMMLVHFGGHALSALAGNLTGQMQGAGAMAGAIVSPEGKAAATSGLVGAAVTDSWHNSNRFDFNKASAAGANLRGADMGRGLGMGSVGRATDAAEFGAYKDTAVNQASRERLDQQQDGWQSRTEVHAGQQAQQLSGAIQGNDAVDQQFGPGSIEKGSSFAAAAANTGNLAKGGSEGTLGKAMSQSWAKGLMEVGKTDESIGNFVNKEFGGNYELAGAAMAMVQNQQTLGAVDSAKAFSEEMNRQHPGMNMTERDALRMLGAANHMRFSGAAAYAAAEADKQGGPNRITAANSGELVNTGETMTRAGIGQAHATEDKAGAIHSSVEEQQRAEQRSVAPHAIDNQMEANLLNNTFGRNSNWSPVGVGDRVGYSLGADGKPATVDVQMAGSSQISRFDTSSDRTKNVVDGADEYTGPMEKQTFASPGGLVRLTMDGEGRVIQGAMDGTIKTEQVVAQKNQNDEIDHSYSSQIMSPEGQVGLEINRGGSLAQNYHGAEEHQAGYSYRGTGSGFIGEAAERITGSEEIGKRAGRTAGALGDLVGSLRGLGATPTSSVGRPGGGINNGAGSRAPNSLGSRPSNGQAQQWRDYFRRTGEIPTQAE
jgi:hypothetical protein